MQNLNPFSDIPSIMRAKEIIEFAHNRSNKVSMKSSLRIPRVERSRIREITKLQEFTKEVKRKLQESVENFPSLDRLHPFYQEMTDVLIGTDRLKQALGAVYNCIEPIDQITRKHLEALKLSDDYLQFKRTRSAAKGRIASVVRGTASHLDLMIEAKTVLSRLPGITPDSPTIVCAGYPNVGKSTLVRRVSTAQPEIAYYPFTTKDVIVGHLTIGDETIQVVDTPGILDRPMSQRNEIERKAIAALRYLGHVIIFMLDASETCGWNIDEQFNLYSEVRRTFPLTPTLVVFNKVDITPADRLSAAKSRIQGTRDIVASTGEGVPELMQAAIEETMLSSPKSPPGSLTPSH